MEYQHKNPIILTILLALVAFISIHRFSKNPRKVLIWLGSCMAIIPLLLYGLGLVPDSEVGLTDSVMYIVIMPFLIGMVYIGCAAEFFTHKKRDHEVKATTTIVEKDPTATCSTDSDEDVLNHCTYEAGENIPISDMDVRKAEIDRKSRLDKAKQYLRYSMSMYKENEIKAVIDVLETYAQEGIIQSPNVPIPPKEDMPNDKLYFIGASVFYLLKGVKYDKKDCCTFLKSTFAESLKNVNSSIDKKLPGQKRIAEKLKDNGFVE